MIPMMRVGAVRNAFCAFCKDRVGALWASTCPAASTRGSSPSPPDAGWLEPLAPFIETPEPHGAKVQVPDPIIDRFEADRLTPQDRADADHARVPRNRATRADASDFVVTGIRERHQLLGKRSPRGGIDPPRRLLGERLV